jgi:hypothetical protein
LTVSETFPYFRVPWVVGASGFGPHASNWMRRVGRLAYNMGRVSFSTWTMQAATGMTRGPESVLQYEDAWGCRDAAGICAGPGS